MLIKHIIYLTILFFCYITFHNNQQKEIIMKKFNKEKLLKKVNKIYQLEEEKNSLSSNLRTMYKQIEKERKILEENQSEYDKLMTSTTITELEKYPTAKIDELISNLDAYPESIKKLEATRSKIFRKYQKINDKIYKLRHSR